jgi:hypothetical protein
MRPIRTIAPLALGLIALAVAGCQSRPDQPPPPSRPRSSRPLPPPPRRPARHGRPAGHRSAPRPSPSPPRARDGCWPVAGPDPGVREDAPGRRRCRPPALAAVAGTGLDRLCHRPVRHHRPSGTQGRPGRIRRRPTQLRMGGHPAPGPARPPRRRRRLGHHPDRKPRGELLGLADPERREHGAVRRSRNPARAKLRRGIAAHRSQRPFVSPPNFAPDGRNPPAEPLVGTSVRR